MTPDPPAGAPDAAPDVPRPEYPRPRLRRERWHNLNGPWAFGFDDDDRGIAERWYAGSAAHLDRRITVPFCYQSELSGIDDRTPHDVVWYARPLPDVRTSPDERLLLHFGAVDHRATVWVDGHRVAEHEGGHTPFSADVTDALSDTDTHEVVVRAEDPYLDLTIPRGKQYWRERPDGIFYTPTTGIWQTVWLEPVAPLRLDRVQLTPDVDAASVTLDLAVTGPPEGAAVHVAVSYDGLTLVDDLVRLTDCAFERSYSVLPPSGAVDAYIGDEQGIALWRPDDPCLYDVHLEVLDRDGARIDAVDTYFGMRKIAVRDGWIELNNRPFYQRLVLDQGYFPRGLLTAPTDADLRRDIELAKALGFDGARKHQKVEDPRWLYWADRLGFLVWSEMPSVYRWSGAGVSRVVATWQEVIERDRSHPCIVAWVPVNESWGVPRQRTDPRHLSLVLALHHLTHALDATRLVIANDGWEHAVGDVLTIHDYSDATTLSQRYGSLESALASQPQGRPIFVGTHGYVSQPILLSEFGGISLEGDPDSWGYDVVTDGEGLRKQYTDLVGAVVSSPILQGFCWTQLTDIEQEANGLLTFDRRPKADLDALRSATRQQKDNRWTFRGRRRSAADPVETS